MAVKHFNPQHYRYWLLPISGLLALISLTFGWSSKSIQAQATPTVTPTPARRPAWSSGGASQLPGQLQQTAQVALGGGDAPVRVCNGIMVSNATPIYDLFPDFGSIAIGHPHIGAELTVGACHGVGPEPVYLIDSSGRRIEPSSGFYNGLCGPTGNGCYLYEFVLEPDIPEGEYQLHIESPMGTFETPLQVRLPWFPFLLITNVDTGASTATSAVAPGQTLVLNFRGFAPDTQAEAVLYQGSWEDLEWNAIDAWQFQTDSDGEYKEELRIPLDADPAPYLVVGCEIHNCKPVLDSLNAPIVEYRDVSPPPLAWEIFDVSDIRVETAVVDPIIAWNGLILKDDPNGVRIGGLAANRNLTVLGAPVIVNDGAEWIEVEDDGTGRRGWVQARYVLFDTVENTYSNLYWTPGCNPQRPEVQRLTVGESPCAPGAEYMSLDDFVDELRTIHLLRQEEWLEPVTTGGRLNESLRIRTASNPHVGWLKIGTANPLSRQSPVGAVWRTPYSSNRLVGSVCWWRIDGAWRCEDS